MSKAVITMEPDTLIMDAQKLMHEHHIRRLPVVDKGKLVGIITTTDVLKILTQVLGFGESGTRIHVHHCGRKQPQYTQVLGLIRKYREQGMGLRALFPVTPSGEGHEDTNIHVDTTDVTSLVKEIQALGCSVEARPHRGPSPIEVV
ncbi:MAG: CBS domain-containing protein [Dehalococcoidia bacterium]|jgi:hypothetical protein|nr:CBS domain-containing protein [Dehalococcoidia bacterium]MDP6782234.1 CBS domain-containing protein [Dehalococcoidia bacterium]